MIHSIFNQEAKKVKQKMYQDNHKIVEKPSKHYRRSDGKPSFCMLFIASKVLKGPKDLENNCTLYLKAPLGWLEMEYLLHACNIM